MNLFLMLTAIAAAWFGSRFVLWLIRRLWLNED
jgi:hypothetical protein